jgi:hypothetical protein
MKKVIVTVVLVTMYVTKALEVERFEFIICSFKLRLFIPVEKPPFTHWPEGRVGPRAGKRRLHLHAVNRTGDHPDPGQSFTHLDVCRF